MGAQLAIPVTCKYIERLGSKQVSIGSCCMNGHRAYMEDEYAVKLWEDGRFFIGVFDGHGGNKCSTYLKKVFPEKLETYPRNPTKKSFADFALDIDKEFNALDHDDGSVATYIYGYGSEDGMNMHLMMGNVGDSRILHIKGSKYYNTITTDHKPNNSSERTRILEDGGIIKDDRVDGDLAISRAFGDKRFKTNENQLKCKVIAKPDLYPIKIVKGKDDVFILISDGVYDTGFNNNAICSFVDAKLKYIDDLGYIAALVCEAALKHGSMDNITCVIVRTFTDGVAYADKYGKELFIPCQQIKADDMKFILAYLNMARRYGEYSEIVSNKKLFKQIKKDRANYFKQISIEIDDDENKDLSEDPNNLPQDPPKFDKDQHELSIMKVFMRTDCS